MKYLAGWAWQMRCSFCSFTCAPVQSERFKIRHHVWAGLFGPMVIDVQGDEENQDAEQINGEENTCREYAQQKQQDQGNGKSDDLFGAQAGPC